MKKRLTASIAAFAVLIGSIVAVSWANESDSAAAITGSDFNAGLIITDSLFYDGSAMTASQVQTFLAGKVPQCANGFICMKDARQSTPTMPAQTGLCSTYVGAQNELVSTIISRVALACGISPKVLLVLIQKEQRLITATAPTQRAFDKATGFGCPDTAPCDPSFSGFFYQVYYAAHQFKYYQYKPQSYSYRAGQINNVRWNPKADCGFSAVYIQNVATASLYNYTPYQPNTAALTNLYGDGDNCSSYGNRNFWTIYTGWFGSTLVGAGEAAIRDAYSAEGGASGALGAIVATPACGELSSACSQSYANGSIYWDKKQGAWPVVGNINAYYGAASEIRTSLGNPTARQTVVANGTRQNFVAAAVYSSSTGTFAVYSLIEREYARLGGPTGALGWPISGDTCGLVGGGCSQPFQSGVLYYSPPSGTHAVSGDINTFYVARGGPAALGFPTLDAVSVAGGSTQPFGSATIYSSGQGTFAVYGVLQTEFARLGGPAGPVGWPTANDSCGLIGGGCSQTFQSGSLYYSPSTGTTLVGGETNTFYVSRGGPDGLGYPQGAAAQLAGGNSQAFTSATVFSSAQGTFGVYGVFRTEFARLAGPDGLLGWPTANDTCGLIGGGCSQPFQNGSLYYSPASGTRSVPHAIDAAFATTGGVAGTLGYPTSAATDIAGGQQQLFTFGTIYSSAAGAYPVTAGIASQYASRGGPLGSLGWPTSIETCVPGGACTQTFQGGTLSIGAIQAFYTARGGSSAFGATVSAETPLGGGSTQAFRNASIYSSAAGTFAVYGVIQTEFARLGGPLAALGWPTANDSCGLIGGGCSQPFQNGVVYYSPATGTFAVVNATNSVFTSLGGLTGTLGYPTGSAVAVAGGTRQAFSGGALFASTAGTFSVVGSLGAQYSAAGGPAGTLGWPTAEQSCVAGGACTQTFQHGSLTIGAIQSFYTSRGGAAAFGATLGAEVPVTGGSSQSFRNATIYSSAAGTFAVYGVIQTEFARLGGPLGAYGWPTANDTCGLVGGGCSQPFQHGSMYYSPATGTDAVPVAIDLLYSSRGGPSAMGYPKGASSAVGAGIKQPFGSSTIYSSSLGTYAVYGVIQDELTRLGGPLGALGWPTANDSCGLAEGGCLQPFENGTIYYSPSGGTRAVPAASNVVYAAAGGVTGALGYPRSAAVNVSTGTRQTFATGAIYASTLGTFAVVGAIASSYTSAGGPTGSLGWPTAAESCAAGTCTQTFQGGTLSR